MIYNKRNKNLNTRNEKVRILAQNVKNNNFNALNEFNNIAPMA